MDFTLSKKHEMARTLFKEFAENEVKPLAQETDENEQFPVETVEKMAKYGFLGIPVPKEYGGQGCDPLTYAMCVEELSKVCGTTGVIVSAHTSLCIDPIMTFGTEEQKKKYVVPLAKGEKLGAFGLTEPGAGTDAQGQQTKAVFDEATNEWVLNGSKCFITNGKYADVYIVIAVTGKVEKRGRMMKEISAFIVEKGTPGFTFGTKEKKMGIRGSATYELIFEDCRIPAFGIGGAAAWPRARISRPCRRTHASRSCPPWSPANRPSHRHRKACSAARTGARPLPQAPRRLRRPWPRPRTAQPSRRAHGTSA